ncbi:MAG: DNA translocase FtsK [Syntrophomonadaceae bacterium]|nr:DNA translocase FtsK [Syntrophomonadaceae bacterium]
MLGTTVPQFYWFINGSEQEKDLYGDSLNLFKEGGASLPKAVKKKKIAPPQKKPRIDLHATLLLGVGLFLGVSLLYYSGKPDDNEIIGFLGTYLVLGMESLFGSLSVLLPGFLVLWSLDIFRSRAYWTSKMTGLAIISSVFLLYFALYRAPQGLEIWEAARLGLGGGVIGGTFAIILTSLTGRLGTNLLMVLALLMGGALLVNRSLKEMIQSLRIWSKKALAYLDKLIFYEEEMTAPEPIILGAKAKVEPEPEPEPILNVHEAKAPPVKIVEESLYVPRIPKKVGHNEYIRPSLDLLSTLENGRVFNKNDIKVSIKTLEDTFVNFGMKIKVNQVSCGPTVTRYELQPAPGIKVSKILSLTDDLQLSLAAKAIRIEAPIPGKSAVGIEVPNEKITPVGLKNILSSNLYENAAHNLTIALGEDISGNPVVANLAEMPHLLVAGSTGSGKSVCLNSIILSLLFKASPEELRLVLIDPKMVELTMFNGIPHLMAPVITDAKKAAMVLRWMLSEMEKRYKRFSENGVRDIYRYNEINLERLPFIVIMIDELADLMMVAPVEVEDAICRLAQMARAAGIHLVVATQRPSVDVVTGIIKANIPSRIAFAVSSQTDSRTILDTGGAEKLLGRGDMLFFPVGAAKPIRIQGAYVSDNDLERVVEYLKSQNRDKDTVAEAAEWESSIEHMNEMESEDELFWEAVKVFVENQKASVSMLQRKLRVGYARAARLVDIMEERGIVSEVDVNRRREVLINEEQLKQLLSRQIM